MNNKYNPWRVSTFTLLLFLSVAVGFSGKIEHFDLQKSIVSAIFLAGIALLVQLPDLISTYIKRGKTND